MFGFKKKVMTASCDCGGKCNPEIKNNSDGLEKAKFIVLGSCCKKSAEMFKNTKIAVNELGIEETVINLGDMKDIASYGVMQTPALVINGRVVSYGKLLKVSEIKDIILKSK